MATQVVLLGTGTPRAEPGRSGASTAVIVEGRPYLFDFGAGVGRRISEGFEQGITGLAMSKVNRAFLTHMHSDHTLGLAELMLAPWMFGRSEPLHVYGPWGTAAMTAALAEAYRLDISKRRYSEPHTRHGHEILGHDVFPGHVYEDHLVSVDAFRVHHGEWIPELHGPDPTLGYRVVTDGRSVVISGDTGPFDGMAEAYATADVLVHEAYSSAGLSVRPSEWQVYHRRSHTSATHLGRVATVSEPGILVLTHQLLWGAGEEELMAELRSSYDGPVAYGRDLDVF